MTDPFPLPATLRDRFRGALLGTAVGDALGAPFEGSPVVDARALDAWAEADDPLRWTDDTHMTIALAGSLIACGGFDGPHMAGRFVSEYDAEPWRGYGPGPPIVFDGIRAGARWDEPAAALFGGTGSYGNGAAMRAAPVGLFAWRDPREVDRIARASARITHAHDLGQDGAAVQARAVAWLVDVAPRPHWLTALGLLEALRAAARTDTFQQKLRSVEQLHSHAGREDAVAVLGNGIAAEEAVPAALYAFCRHIRSFREAVTAAVMLGGDTDTIAAMAGALAGAFHGIAGIPRRWLQRVEAAGRLRDLADDLLAAATRSRAEA